MSVAGVVYFPPGQPNISGSGTFTAGRVIFASDSTTLDDDSKLTFDNTNKILVVGGTAEATTTSGQQINVFNDGAAKIVIRDSTNNVEGLISAGTSNVEFGSVSASTVRLLAGGSAAHTINSSREISFTPGGSTSTAPFTITPAASFTATSGATRGVSLNGTFAPSSGNGTYTHAELAYTINQSGGANGNVFGLLINGTHTAVGGTAVPMAVYVGGASKFEISAGGTVTLADSANIAVNTSTGTKIGTATTQKLGFWNQAPTAQYSTTGTTTGYVNVGGGTDVQETSTFTGGSGTKAYTIGDIVLALKTCGIMAAS